MTRRELDAPIVPEHDALTSVATPSAKALPGLISDHQTLSILLVDDSAADRALIEHFLGDPSLLGTPATLTVAGDADTALAAVREHARFAAILLDYSLPGRDGLEFLRELRASGDRTPVIVITGTGDESVAVQALRLGASDYLVKQVGFEHALPVVIERALRSAALELEVTRARQHEVEYTRRLEQKVEEQTRSLQRALQESEALRRVARSLAASRQLQPALDVVARAAVAITHAQAGAVILRTGQEFALVSSSGAVDQPRGTKRHDLCAHLEQQMRETAISPLREGNTEIGLLWIGRRRFQPFSRHELELLESLADATGLAITNLRALERLRQMEPGQPRRGSTVPSETPPTASLTSTAIAAGGVVAPAAQAARHRGDDDAGNTAPSHASVTRSPASHASESAAKIAAPAATTFDKPQQVPFGIPSFTPTLARIIQLDSDPDASPDAVVDAAALDPVLTARAIQLASSAGLGRARPASSLREAIVVIGFRAIRNLAFAQFARGMLTRRRPIDEQLWEQSLATAVGTQLVLELSQPGLAEDGYLCGLLHNLGEIAVNNAYPEQFEAAIHQSIVSEQPMVEIEETVLPVPPSRVLRDVLQEWPLPPRIARILTGRQSAVDESLIQALTWARATAWRSNPAWHSLLGNRVEPAWLDEQVVAAEKALAVSGDVLAGLRQRLEDRRSMYRSLLS